MHQECECYGIYSDDEATEHEEVSTNTFFETSSERPRTAKDNNSDYDLTTGDEFVQTSQPTSARSNSSSHCSAPAAASATDATERPEDGRSGHVEATIRSCSELRALVEMYFAANFDNKHGYTHGPETLFVLMLEYQMDRIHPDSHFRDGARGERRNKVTYVIEPGHGGHENARRALPILHSYIEEVEDDAEDDYREDLEAKEGTLLEVVHDERDPDLSHRIYEKYYLARGRRHADAEPERCSTQVADCEPDALEVGADADGPRETCDSADVDAAVIYASREEAIEQGHVAGPEATYDLDSSSVVPLVESLAAVPKAASDSAVPFTSCQSSIHFRWKESLIQCGLQRCLSKAPPRSGQGAL